MKRLNSQAGFTIVELMIATAVFSIVLMVCSFAIIHVGKMYYKGVLTNRTQDTARRLVDDVASSVQFGIKAEDPAIFRRTGSGVINGVNVESLCVGNIRYTFSRRNYLGEIRHVVWRDQVTTQSCGLLDLTADIPSPNGQEMLGANMRVPEGITANPSGQLWNISLVVSYGDSTDLFVDPVNPIICKGVTAGGQFCAVSRFSTSVTKRL
ncbi:MAG: prepilin-type N-terminal cleavage/methylation domain-containing protein [bacterium]|nr:prepilin-type N-terminal cleavage/methylation domain-containing protein [bacterium]